MVYQGLQITLVYTLAVYLVRYYRPRASEERIGQLTGLLVSHRSLMQASRSEQAHLTAVALTLGTACRLQASLLPSL